MKARNWRVWERGGKLLGRFDLELDSGMIIKQVSLINGEYGRFVALPQNAFTTRDGTKRYTPIIEFVDASRAKTFATAALLAIDLIRGSVVEGDGEEAA